MTKELKMRDVVGGIIDKKHINDDGKMSFLVTLKTNAYEDGHVNWLKSNFEKWKKETEKIPGLSFNYINIHKASKKGAEGSIAVGMNISGSVLSTPAGNICFMGNLISAIRKTLAEIVLSCYPPRFDYKNPLFDALNVYEYVFTPAYSSREIEEFGEKINRLITNPINLATMIQKCGALFHDIRYDADNELVSVALKWRQHATEEKREMLENTFRAFFLGMGIDCFNLKIQPQ